MNEFTQPLRPLVTGRGDFFLPHPHRETLVDGTRQNDSWNSDGHI